MRKQSIGLLWNLEGHKLKKYHSIWSFLNTEKLAKNSTDPSWLKKVRLKGILEGLEEKITFKLHTTKFESLKKKRAANNKGFFGSLLTRVCTNHSVKVSYK